MKSILPIITLSLLLLSCEKDYYYDVDCTNSGGYIGGWEKDDSTHTIHSKDSVNGFDIELNNWGDTINNEFTI